MADISRFTPDDLKPVSALYRRVFGVDAADGNRLRWEWQYLRNPNIPPEGPQIWVAREGPTVVGQYATMPVRLVVGGRETAGSWGMDVMVAPERQRQGLGEQLFRTWDQHVGASLGLGLSESSYRLFQQLHWPTLGPVPRLVKPLTRRALRRPNWPMPINRLISAVTLPFVRIRGTRQAAGRGDRIGAPVRRPVHRAWIGCRDAFDVAVRRDAAHLT